MPYTLTSIPPSPSKIILNLYDKIVIFNLLWSEFVETNATFRSASTDLDQIKIKSNQVLFSHT